MSRKEEEFEIGQPIRFRKNNGSIAAGEILALSAGKSAALVFSQDEGHVRRGLGAIGDLIALDRIIPVSDKIA